MDTTIIGVIISMFGVALISSFGFSMKLILNRIDGLDTKIDNLDTKVDNNRDAIEENGRKIIELAGEVKANGREIRANRREIEIIRLGKPLSETETKTSVSAPGQTAAEPESADDDTAPDRSTVKEDSTRL